MQIIIVSIIYIAIKLQLTLIKTWSQLFVGHVAALWDYLLKLIRSTVAD